MNLANISATKPNKLVALSLVKDLGNGKLDDRQKQLALAQLYQFFIPNAPSKPKTAEQWIYKSLAKKDVRYYLNYLYSDGSSLVATDGHRLHVVHNMDYPKGSYDKAMSLIDDQVAGKFPEWERVIPKDKGRLKVQFEDLELKIDDNGKIHFYKVYFNSELKVAINKKYLDDALSFLDNPRVSIGSESDSILLTDDSRQAVIMPIKM